MRTKILTLIGQYGGWAYERMVIVFFLISADGETH